jgi:thiamine biosynthesis protein ThiS
MELIINGKPMDLPDGLTIEGLLAHLGVPRQFTAVALNREVALRSRYAEIALREGDRVEIVRPMGGG